MNPLANAPVASETASAPFGTSIAPIAIARPAPPRAARDHRIARSERAVKVHGWPRPRTTPVSVSRTRTRPRYRRCRRGAGQAAGAALASRSDPVLDGPEPTGTCRPAVRAGHGDGGRAASGAVAASYRR